MKAIPKVSRQPQFVASLYFRSFQIISYIHVDFVCDLLCKSEAEALLLHATPSVLNECSATPTTRLVPNELSPNRLWCNNILETHFKSLFFCIKKVYITIVRRCYKETFVYVLLSNVVNKKKMCHWPLGAGYGLPPFTASCCRWLFSFVFLPHIFTIVSIETFVVLYVHEEKDLRQSIAQSFRQQKNNAVRGAVCARAHTFMAPRIFNNNKWRWQQSNKTARNRKKLSEIERKKKPTDSIFYRDDVRCPYYPICGRHQQMT